MTWTLHKDGGQAHRVRRGTTLFIPRGTPHFYANPTHTAGRILCLQTPVLSARSITSKSPPSTAPAGIPTWRVSAPS